MGAAAYNRGTKVIREQLTDDHDLAWAKAQAGHWQNKAESIAKELEAAKSELAHAKRVYNVRVAERDVYREEAETLRDQLAHLEETIKAIQGQCNEYSEKWIKCSKVLVYIQQEVEYWTDEQFDSIRQEAYKWFSKG